MPHSPAGADLKNEAMEALRWPCAHVWRPGAYAPGLSFHVKDARRLGKYSIFKQQSRVTGRSQGTIFD